jgi:alkylation response protein AidB-like acyl-CoA dehydrogenase
VRGLPAPRPRDLSSHDKHGRTTIADFGGAENDAFRIEAREWLAENFPPSLRADPAAQMAAMMGQTPSPDVALWTRRMGETGWGTPTWPKAYGGGGLSRPEARVLAEEMAAIGARTPIGGMGVMMLGPTLLEYGTETQKQRHNPHIVRGETRWRQGYSEPGSGSDLASLQTRCEDKGEDGWLINGQKIWTSGANLADWCFCLVRTDPTKKHEGISFILIDMTSPGVETRPIRLINRASPFCETFFTDVKVPRRTWSGRSAAAGRSPSASCSSSARTSPRASAAATRRSARPPVSMSWQNATWDRRQTAGWRTPTCAPGSSPTRCRPAPFS